MPELSNLPPPIRCYVSAYVSRGRRLALLRWTGIALGLLLLWTLLWCGIDRVFQIPGGPRLAAMIVGIAGTLVLVAGPFRRWSAGEADWIAAAQEIEQHDPRFEQRLVTVTSRLLGRPEHRGSDEILEHLIYQVDRQVSRRSASALLPAGSALAPWLFVLLLLGVGAGLCFIPDFKLPRLAARFFAPWVALSPVTTASLSVSPGNCDVPQTNPLEIAADAKRVGAGQVWISVSDDEGKTWSRSAMTGSGIGVSGEERYAYSIASVDRDMQYFVSGGDAQSPTYAVRVLRRPAISEFKFRYIYPAYTGKQPLSVTNTDGVIEAPVGTVAEVTIVATEPLQTALITTPGGEKILLGRDSADNARHGRLTVQHDGRYQVDLVSTREVTGSGPPTTQIHAQVDHAPAIRVAEAGATLRLNPHDVLTLHYDALDDYGIDAVTAHVQYGDQQPIELPVYPGDGGAIGPGIASRSDDFTRRVSGRFDVDLAGLPIQIGDVLSVVVAARDTGAQTSSASPVQIVVSPQSITPQVYDRINDLKEAAGLSDAIVDELTGAIKVIESSAAEVSAGTNISAAIAQRDRHLNSALEMSASMRHALLHAIAQGAPPQLCVVIAAWMDRSQMLSSRISELLRSPDPAAAAAQWSRALDQVRAAADMSRQVQSNLKTISQGQQAESILADFESVAPTGASPDAGKSEGRVKKVLRRIQDDIATAAMDIGLDAGASDFKAQLKSRVQASRSAVEAQKTIDFAAVARDMRGQPEPMPEKGRREKSSARTFRGELSERLLEASEAEAVRQDADLVRAGDLQLASRAAAMLHFDGAAGRDEFADALSALQRDHELNRQQQASMAQPMDHDKAQEIEIRQAAGRARRQLENWSGQLASANPGKSDSHVTTQSSGPATPEDAESLALRASAASAQHRYGEATEADRRLREVVEHLVIPDAGSHISPERSQIIAAQRARLQQTGEQVSRSMQTSQKLDNFSDGQRKLAEETSRITDASATVLAARQGKLADDISQLSRSRSSGAALADANTSSQDPNWRDRAASTVLSAQISVSAMPQQLADALSAAEEYRHCVARARTAHEEADAASPEHRPAASHAGEQADQDKTEALRHLKSVADPLRPDMIEAMARSLEPFAPETTAARDALSGLLLPAVKSLEQAFQSGDSDATSRSAAAVRQGIDSVQINLAAARDQIAQRDPLVAARWFARTAAEALRRKPPNVPLALQQQDLTARALTMAWNASVHRAATFRFSELPELRGFYEADSVPTNRSRLTGTHSDDDTSGDTESASAARNRRRWNTRADDAPAGTPHQPDPAGYESALRAYFEALQNVGNDKNR